MDKIINPGPSFTAWGPFVRDNYTVLPVTRTDVIVASTIFSLANVFALTAAYIAVRQTRSARRPLKSVYIWMIWLEWAACVVLSIECLLYLFRVIRPSFYFFMSLLLCWAIQTQLLLQIIINRIRIILHDKRRGRQLTIGTAIVVTLINISVFCVWIPARLQISKNWIHINNIWDRIEKGLYLLIDVCLNYYFIRVVKVNLIENGLEKYNHLARFNQRIIVVSILMDVMIIGAMSIPNGFVYAIFHPLAYLVKLNIEMSMAHLIKTIALGGQHNSDNFSFLHTFGTSSDDSGPSYENGIFAEQPRERYALIRGLFGRGSHRSSLKGDEIRKTEEFVVRSSPRQNLETHPQTDAIEPSIRTEVNLTELPGVVHLNEVYSTRSTDDENASNGAERLRIMESTDDCENLVKPKPVLVLSHGTKDK